MSLQQFFKRVAPCMRYLSGVMIFTVFMLNANPGWCEYKSMEDRIVSLLKYSAGIFSAFMIHEGAHLVAAKATGTDMDWELGNYNQPLAYTEETDNDADGLIINSSGLVAQALASEIILQVDSIDKNDDFVRGMMYWNILNPIFYALDYWFIHVTNDQTELKILSDYDDIWCRDKTSVDALRSRLLISQFGFRETQHEKITHYCGDHFTALYRFCHLFNPV
ncbi:MAG: hypothetical protein KAI93_08635 [Desulfobacterales bacterium]|nr:hypothetical protein [Desulfobacterales bacterium]